MSPIALPNIVDEMRSKPYTMILILALAGATTYLWNHTASAQEVQQVSTQVQEIKAGLIEAHLNAIKAQLFDLRAKIADKLKAHQSVDSIYTDKVKELEAEQEHTERELARAGH